MIYVWYNKEYSRANSNSPLLRTPSYDKFA